MGEGLRNISWVLTLLDWSRPLKRIPQGVREEVKDRRCLCSEKKGPQGSLGPQPYQGYPCGLLGPGPMHLPTITLSLLIPFLPHLCLPGQLFCAFQNWDLASPPTDAIPDRPRLTWIASSPPLGSCAHPYLTLVLQTTHLSTPPDCELRESRVFVSPAPTTMPSVWLALNVYRMNEQRAD